MKTLLNIPGIYIFTNKKNGKRYVGESLYIRTRLGRYTASKPTRIFERAILKYGIENFDLEIVYYPYANKEFLLNVEKLLIREYDCLIPYGYNYCDVGQNNSGIKRPEEFCKRMSILNKGRTVSSETRKKISDTNKGYIHTIESKKKISDASLGRKHSEDSKKKMSENHSRWNLGKSGYENPCSKTVLQFSLEGKFIAEFGSTADASKTTGVLNVSICCNNKLRQAGGFMWKYKEDIFPDYNKRFTSDDGISIPPLEDRVFTDEYRQKCSEIHKGKVNSDETRRKMSAGRKNKKPVFQFTTDNELIAEYESIAKAFEKTNVHRSLIRKCCNGGTKMAGGFVFKYST